MPSTAYSAQGSVLKIDDSTPGTPDVIIGNLISFSGFDGQANDLDKTNLASTAKEKTVGLKDYGQFTGEWHVDHSDVGQVVMRTAHGTDTEKTFSLTLPDTTVVTFTGAVQSAAGMTGGVDALVGGSFTVALSGEPTYT